jgi:hypothetical protein
MAGMNKSTLRDLPNQPVNYNSNPVSDYVDSLPDSRSVFDRTRSLDPSDPQHMPVLSQLVEATVQGLLNEDQVKKLMNRNPSAAPVFANALANQKLYKEKTGNIQSALGQSFQPEISIPQGQEGPTRPESFDYMKAINRLNAIGETERASALAKQYEQISTASNKGSNNYGGVQYSIDSKGNIVPYVINERTNQTTPIQPPEGTKATVPVAPTPGIGPGGPGIYNVPTRAAGSATPSQVPGVSPMPTTEEAKAAGSAETAFDMGGRLKDYVSQKKISVGPVNGRLLRAKASTGVGNLTDEEADAISIEQNLSNQLLQAMRGAQVGPLEQERFNKSLPQLDQPEALFKANIKNTMNNLNMLQRRIASQRPIKAPTNAPTTSTKEVDFSQLKSRNR